MAIAKTRSKEPTNPFAGRNAGEVWNEMLSNSQPISKEAAYKKMRQLARAQKEKE